MKIQSIEPTYSYLVLRGPYYLASWAVPEAGNNYNDYILQQTENRKQIVLSRLTL